ELLGIALVAEGETGSTTAGEQAGFAPMYVPLAGAADDAEGHPAPLPEPEALAALRPLLEDPAVAKGSPNAKQAMVALARRGIELRGVEFDSGLAAYLVEASSRTLSLQDLSWSRLNRELPGIKTVTGEGR